MNTGAKNSIREVIDAVKTEHGMKTPEKFWVDYAQVSPQEAERIFNATGIKVDTSYVHTFIGNSVAHVNRRHGNETEKRGDQQPVTEADLGAIPEIIKTTDKIASGTKKSSIGNDTIVYLKEAPEGDMLVVEEVRHKRKKLAFYTMRKAKRGYTYDLKSAGHSIKKKG